MYIHETKSIALLYSSETALSRICLEIHTALFVLDADLFSVSFQIIDNPDHGSINKTGCLWNRIEGLDNLIQHIPTRMITDQQLFDPSQIMSEERTSGCIRKNRLTKAQAMLLRLSI